MKTNKIMRIASVLLVAVMLSTCAISGTFAKYVSTASAEDTATVAKWSFDLAGNDDQSTSFAFDLFNTVKEFDTTTAEEHVSGNKIAPGTGGSFDIKLVNKGEATANYAINFTVENTNNNIPLQYKVGDGNWGNTLDAANGTIKFENDASDDEATVTVYWRWVFQTYVAATEYNANTTYYTSEGTAVEHGSEDGKVNAENVGEFYVVSTANDTSDTSFGAAGTAPTVKVTANVTLTQVD